MVQRKSGRLKLKDKEALIPSNVPFQIHLLGQTMTRALMQEVLGKYALTTLHWGVLCCLWREDGVHTTTIAHCLDQLGGNITVGLDTMEKRDLVTRKTDEVDRRVMRVYLTDRGRSLEPLLVPAAARLIERMLGHLSHREYESVLNDLIYMRERVTNVLEHPSVTR